MEHELQGIYIATQSGKPDFQSLVLQFILERFLCRIGQFQYKKRFLLKGAMLFSLWYEIPHRTTRDIDLLAFADNDLSVMKKLFQEILSAKPLPEIAKQLRNNLQSIFT